MIGYTTFMKHAEKVTKAASAARPVLKGVHHTEAGDLVVTDSHRLYVAKGAQAQKDGSVVCPKTGATIDGSYPDTSRLIPENNPKMTVELDVIATLKAAKALKSCAQLAEKIPTMWMKVADDSEVKLVVDNAQISAQYNVGVGDITESHDLYFNGQYFIDALELFKDAGCTTVTLKTHGAARPFTLSKGDDLIALLLPIRTY